MTDPMLTNDPATKAAFVESLIDGMLPMVAEVYEQTGEVFELALDVASDRVFSAWSERLTREVAGVVAALCLRVIQSREAYRLATGATTYAPADRGRL